MEDIIRQRVSPHIYDFNYFVLRNNLSGMKYVHRLLNKKHHLHILDVGCGKKPFQSLFKDADYVGVDFTKKDTYADKIVDLNTNKLPFTDNSFDLVILSETMEHVYNNKNLISEIKRVVKKGGLIFVSSPLNFPEHGAPHDFYRFTKYYYLLTFKEFRSVKYAGSNSIITTPSVQFNIILSQVSRILNVIIIINNCWISICDRFLFKIFSKNKRVTSFLSSNPVGYYFIFQKN